MVSSTSCRTCQPRTTLWRRKAAARLLFPLIPVAFELTQTAADSAHCLARSPRNGFHTFCSLGPRTSCSPAGGLPRAHARAGVDEHAPQHLPPLQHGACSEHACARRARERRAPSTHPAASAPQLAPIVLRARLQPFGGGGGWQATGEGRRGATPTKPATSLTCRHCLLLAALALLRYVLCCLLVQTMQPSDHDSTCHLTIGREEDACSLPLLPASYPRLRCCAPVSTRLSRTVPGLGQHVVQPCRRLPLGALAAYCAGNGRRRGGCR